MEITRLELLKVNELSNRTYSNNTMKTNASDEEISFLKDFKNKLLSVVDIYAKKYEVYYGPFLTDKSKGNPLKRDGKSLNRVWACLYKGSDNKQYAAQLSIVARLDTPQIDLGFYFGRASSHILRGKERDKANEELYKIKKQIIDKLKINSTFKDEFIKLFEYGFKAYVDYNEVPPAEWIRANSTNNNPHTEIIVKLPKAEHEVVGLLEIESYISKIMFLFSAIGSDEKNKDSFELKILPPDPEQAAENARRRAEIGNRGEQFILARERKKLARLNLLSEKYPRHVASESTTYGYDILSLDENGSEIFIEVKTTTRIKSDIDSRKFFITTNEIDTLRRNMSKYHIYRVYDIEANPEFEELEFDEELLIANGYIVQY